MRLTLLLPILLLGWSSLEVVTSSESAAASTVEVTLNQGTIKTSRVDLEDGKYFYAFKNIPFAEPPVGPRRFKEPVAAGSWSGTREGTVDPSPCPQIDMKTFFSGEMMTIGEEDCLYLNVYTPRPYASDLPVMVWIHGGGFILGSIREYSPEPLLTKDLVVVTIQYRLGTLGFLSTEDSVIPGNLGLKDQVMALQWVQENIHNFGGDADKVTIFGESAGGISVHFLMMSPMTEGLFHQAIAQSGTALLPGFLRTNPRKIAIALGQKLECEGVDPADFNSQALYDCLQNLPTENFVMLANAFVEFGTAPQVMVPSIDGSFLPDHPLKLLKEGRYHRVNFMTGITKDEGVISVGPMLINRPMTDALAVNFTTAGPLVLNFDADEEHKLYMAKRIFYHYLQDLNVTEENADQAVKMFGDLMFNIPMDNTAKMHARDAVYGKKTYLYEFHHISQFSFMNLLNISSRDWVCHGDEIQYLFYMPTFNVSLARDQDIFMRDIMVALWTNFAITGNPTPDLSLGFKWTPVSDPEDLNFMILKTSPYMQSYTRGQEFDFWMNLPFNQNRMYFPERFRTEE